MSPSDGIQTATAGQDQVRLWDAATGKLLGGWSGTTENFVRIGHSLFALLAGWLGGQLSRRLCRASRDPEPRRRLSLEEVLGDRSLSAFLFPFQRLREHAMRRFRFHIGTLVILVLFLGVGFAALRESNDIWDSSIFTLTLGVL